MIPPNAPNLSWRVMSCRPNAVFCSLCSAEETYAGKLFVRQLGRAELTQPRVPSLRTKTTTGFGYFCGEGRSQLSSAHVDPTVFSCVCLGQGQDGLWKVDFEGYRNTADGLRKNVANLVTLAHSALGQLEKLQYFEV